MLLSESITRIRRILRDRDGGVVSDAAIIRMWDKVQNRYVVETGILESFVDLPVPPTAYATYTQEWENDFTSKPSTIIYNFLAPYSYTQPWEPVADVGQSPLTSGGVTCTQGWESFYDTIQNRVPHHFPDELSSLVFIAYDQKPIEAVHSKSVEEGNTAFKSRNGVYPYIYIDDSGSGEFYLYPRVDAVYGLDDLSDENGAIAYDDSGTITFDSDYGVSVFSTTDTLSSNYGVVVNYQTEDDALHLIYKRFPQAVNESTDVIDLPRWCVQYVEWGVLAELFKTNTDLFNKELSTHFESRFVAGISVGRFVSSKRRTMRKYILSGRNVQGNQRALADLPSHYPSLWR